MTAVAVIGTGQTKHARRRDDVSQAELVREAALAALTDAELTPRELDAVVLALAAASSGIVGSTG